MTTSSTTRTGLLGPGPPLNPAVLDARLEGGLGDTGRAHACALDTPVNRTVDIGCGHAQSFAAMFTDYAEVAGLSRRRVFALPPSRPVALRVLDRHGHAHSAGDRNAADGSGWGSPADVARSAEAVEQLRGGGR